MVLKALDTKSFIFKETIQLLEAKMETQKMINANVDLAKAEANAKIIADMDNAQASFMAARAEKKRLEEMKNTGLASS